MGTIEKTVFLSYRRSNASWALAIFQNLTNHGYDVFFDFNGIASGDFERVIVENIRARAHFLVLLTPSALERCGNREDWLRREIEAALDNERNVVPLMLEGFDFSTPGIVSQLTGRLTVLKNYNALRVPADYFAEAMARLREKFLNIPLDTVLHPVSIAAQQAARTQQGDARTAPPVPQNELTADEWFERGFFSTSVDDKLHFFSQAIRLDPNHQLAFHNRGYARSAKGDIGGALLDYNEAIRLRPDSAAALHNRGVARYAKGDIEGALRDYNEAIRLKPDLGEAFHNRGVLRMEPVGDLKGALQDYNEAIRLKPEAMSFRERGNVLRALGDVNGAIEDFTEAIKRETNIDNFILRAAARQAKGDLKGALLDYNEAKRLGYKPKE